MEETKDPIFHVRSMIRDQVRLKECEGILEQQYDVNALQDRKKRLYIKMVLSQEYGVEWRYVYSMLKQTDIKNVLRIVTIHFPLFIFNASARMRGRVNASAKMRGHVHHLQYALALVKKLEDNNMSVDFIRVMIDAFTKKDNLIGMINYLISGYPVNRLTTLIREGNAAEEIIEHARERIQR